MSARRSPAARSGNARYAGLPDGEVAGRADDRGVRDVIAQGINVKEFEMRARHSLTRGMVLAVLTTAVVAGPATAALARAGTTGTARSGSPHGLVAGAAARPAASHAVRPGGATCRVSALPLPDGTTRSEVTAGDPTGRYLVGSASVAVGSGSVSVPLLWVRGQLRSLPALSGQVEYTDVNASGTVIGYVRDSAGRAHGWVYHHGRYTFLRGLRPADDVYPRFVNTRGDVAGESVDASTGDMSGFSLVRWSTHHPRGPRELVSPGRTALADIDDDGTVIGSAFLDINRSYIWPRGGPAQVLRGPSGTLDFGAVGLRKGWLGGSEDVTVMETKSAVAWNRRTGVVHRFTNPDYIANAVNGHGDLLLTGGLVPSTLAHHDGRLVALPGLGGGNILGARVLADNGMAAGWSRDREVHAVVWLGC